MNAKDFLDKLRRNPKPIFFLSPVISRTLGIENLLPNLHIITIKKDPLINALRDNGASVFCFEDICEQEIVKNSFELLNHALVKAFIQEKSGPFTPQILTFRALAQIEHLCKEMKYNYLVANPFVVRDLEDKVYFAKLLEKVKIKTIDTQIRTLETCVFSSPKMVLQLRRGFMGNSTFVINSEKEFKQFQEQYGKHQVKLMPFIEGKTLTLNGCITQNTAQMSHPFYQIQGEKDMNSNVMGTVGNSHFVLQDLSGETLVKIYQLTDQISKAIYEVGFRGFFGLDLLLGDDNEVYPIECNPRLTASVGNFTQMEKARGITPIILRHIAFFLGYELEQEKIVMSDFAYTFLVFRNTTKKNMVLTKDLKPGIYKLGKAFVFKHESLDFTECKKNEFFLLPSLKGEEIEPDKEYLFVLTKEKLCDKNKILGHYKEAFSNYLT